MQTKVYFIKGDITEMAVDAIVNPANTELVMSSGVAGTILKKGGQRIQEECDRLSPVRLGQVVATTGGNLKAHYVFHAASMPLGGATTRESLQMVIRASLLRAEEKTIKTIAFPAIGTGVGGFPMRDCARIMIEEVLRHRKMVSSLERIFFVLFDDAALKTFEETYTELTGRPTSAPVG
ncbi:MAG TPA: macro domain-containing protein [Terriglobia bacterium]|jgi:O-acetyl-ADP-ribose deacetylase (regulator of RNase III)|nr:macro domain-containing protein [Terriglobia bacterium]